MPHVDELPARNTLCDLALLAHFVVANDTEPTLARGLRGWWRWRFVHPLVVFIAAAAAKVHLALVLWICVAWWKWKHATAALRVPIINGICNFRPGSVCHPGRQIPILIVCLMGCGFFRSTLESEDSLEPSLPASPNYPAKGQGVG